MGNDIEKLKIDKKPTVFVAEMEKPSWDVFFMGLAYYYCTRSPDQQTKAGCMIVDWDTKIPIGTGYNGHPRGMHGLPTMREGSVLDESVHIPGDEKFGLGRLFYKGEVVPKELRSQVPLDSIQGPEDKYSVMVHADLNAIVNCIQPSANAVGYLPFEPCENCLLAWLSKVSPKVEFRRIVILTSRPFPNFKRLIDKRRDIEIEIMVDTIHKNRELGIATPANDPALALFQASQYCNLMIEQSLELSKDSAKTYGRSH